MFGANASTTTTVQKHEGSIFVSTVQHRSSRSVSGTVAIHKRLAYILVYHTNGRLLCADISEDTIRHKPESIGTLSYYGIGQACCALKKLLWIGTRYLVA